MSASILITALLSLGQARAADREVSLELGRMGAPSPGWDLFNQDSGQVGTWGVRAGMPVAEHVTALASWNHGVFGGEVWPGDGDSSFMAAFTADEFTLGVKAGLPIADWCQGYGTVQALAFRGRMRFDDDAEDRNNPDQLKASALAPGGIAALGAELYLLPSKFSVRPATYLEAGYAQAAKLSFTADQAGGAPIGDLVFKGFYLHWGMGVRF